MSNYWDKLTAEEIQAFERMLESPDPDLYAWFMGYEQTEDESFKHMVALIRRFGTP